MSTIPAHTHALPWPPSHHVVADRVDVSRDFMTWHTGIRKPRPEPVFD